MKTRLSTVFSLVMLASMLLAACGTVTTVAPTTVAPTATQPPVAQATNTTAPQPTATSVPPTPTATPVPRLGGWLDQVVFTGQPDNAAGVAQLQAGAVDMFLNSSLTDANLFAKVKADTNLKYASVYGSSDQLLFNASTCTDKNLLNPFTSAPIREAMNYIVDRNYVAQEIQGGLATPMWTAFDPAFPDAARYAGLIGAIATKYAYNMDKAQAVIDAEMPKLGATKGSDGKWQFNGKPVTLIGLIRTEDTRKQIGIYFANQLEKLGFTVDQQLKKRSEASPIWAQADPKTCKFNYYTAGWINTAIIRDEGSVFATFGSGKVQNIPAFLDYKPSKELSDAEDALLTNSFTTMDQRDQLVTTALGLEMQEGWWGVWVIAPFAFEPYTNKISVAADLAAGQSNQLMPYTLRFNGQVGGTARIIQSGIMVDPWNPVQGSNWTDDATVEYLTMDFGIVPDPYTGLYLPKLVTKGDLVAKKGLPIAKNLDWDTLSFQDSVTVPDDAWADWDAKTQTFVSAKDRAAADKNYKQTANVQVTVTYTPDLYKTKWHDGSNFSVADVLWGMIMLFDPGKKDSKIYDEGYTATLDAFMSHFKGVKIVSTDPLTITTWDDAWFTDAELNFYGTYGNNSWYPTRGVYAYGTGAWHNQVPLVLAEMDNKMAMSADKATKLKVDRTGMIAGPTLAIQKTYLDQVAASGDFPYAPTLSKYITADDAKARYANLEKFYGAHNVMWLGTGPYFIDKVDSTAGSITLSRFPDYMFSADQFAGFSEPQIAAATVDGPTQVKAGDDAQFTVTVKFKDKPYPSKDIDKVAYTLFDAAGNVVTSGVAKLAAEGSYTIDITPDISGKLTAGSSQLSVAVSSKVVALPTFVTYQFVATQ